MEKYINNFIFAIKLSFDDLNKVVDEVLNQTIYSEEERRSLFYAVGTCMHWILDYADRVIISEEYVPYISAFRYINNGLKHCTEVYEITTDEGGLSFPVEFPLEIPEREIVWSVVDNGRYESQRNNYKVLLHKKDVLSTCKKAMDILMNSELKG